MPLFISSRKWFHYHSRGMKLQKLHLRIEPSLSIKNANNITMPHSCLKSTPDRRRLLNNITSTTHHWNNFKFIAYTLAIIHMLKRHTRRSDPTWCLLPRASVIREMWMFRCEMFITHYCYHRRRCFASNREREIRFVRFNSCHECVIATNACASNGFKLRRI